MRGLKVLIGVVIIVLLSTFWVLNVSTADNPVFIVANNSDQQIRITVTTPEKVKDLGSVASGGKRSFKARDETTMTLRVRYSDGRELDSSPMYFTNGIRVIATVDKETIELEREAAE